MRLYLVFVVVFFLIVLFSELLPKRKELHEMYSRMNDIVRSTDQQINLDIFESENERIEFCPNPLNYNAVLYLRETNKSSMTEKAIDLVSRAIAKREGRNIGHYLAIREKMMNYAESAGMIS